MAHKIDFSKGTAAYIGANGAPAWHGLGTTLDGAVSTQQALELGGLDFQVIKLPNLHYLPSFDGGVGETRISENSFFTLRTDTNGILGDRLGRDYTVLQNIEALNVVDEILQAGAGTIETAGALDEGRKVFICLKVNADIVVNGNDTVKQYVLFTNSHDGSLAITAMFTNIRVVCNNTLTAALSEARKADKIKIRHTANASDRLKEAAKILGLIKTNTEQNAEQYGKMQMHVISKAEILDYFGNVFFSAEEIKGLKAGAKAKELLSTQKINTLEKVAAFAATGIGQSLAMKGNDHTMWSAYNAVTGYITRKSFSSYNDRANNLLFGSGAEVVERAGVLAANPSQIVKLSATATGGLFLN